MNKPEIAAAAGVLAALTVAGCGCKYLRDSVADSFHAVQDGIVDGPTAVKDFFEDGWNALTAYFKSDSNAAAF